MGRKWGRLKPCLSVNLHVTMFDFYWSVGGARCRGMEFHGIVDELFRFVKLLTTDGIAKHGCPASA